jgi:putative ABC transport system substrate-binding protein
MTRRIQISLLLAVALLGGAAELRAERLVVVRSGEITPYIQAQEGMTGLLGEHELILLTLDGRQERWPTIEERIEAEAPDAVVAIGSLATALASRRVEDVPVVFTMVVNPEKLLEEGGPPTTGVSMDPDPRRVFRHAREAIPGLRRIGILYDPKHSQERVDEGRIAAAAMGIHLEAVEVSETRDLPRALRELLDADVDALWLVVDRTVLATREGLELIMVETLREGIPVVAPSHRYAKAGALMALNVDYEMLGEQTARLLLEVLQRRRMAPGTALPPTQRPERLELILNDKARETLRVEIPDEVQEQATRVIR